MPFKNIRLRFTLEEIVLKSRPSSGRVGVISSSNYMIMTLLQQTCNWREIFSVYVFRGSREKNLSCQCWKCFWTTVPISHCRHPVTWFRGPELLSSFCCVYMTSLLCLMRHSDRMQVWLRVFNKTHRKRYRVVRQDDKGKFCILPGPHTKNWEPDDLICWLANIN